MSDEAKGIIAATTAAAEPSVGSVSAGETGQEPAVHIKDPVEEVVHQEHSRQAEKKDEDLFSSKFAALSRKEKELRRKEAELDEKLTGFQTAETLQDRMKERPLKVLEELGISYEDLTQMALNEGSPTTEMMLKRMKEEHDAQLEELRNEYLSDKEADAEAKAQQVIDNFVDEITHFVNEDESYELIRAQDGVGLVYDVIEQYHEDTGRILDIKEASDMVEQYLEEQIKTTLSKVKKLKDLGLTQAQAEEAVEAGESKQESSQVTLSNDHTTQVPTSRGKKLSREESLAHAASLLRWDD